MAWFEATNKWLTGWLERPPVTLDGSAVGLAVIDGAVWDALAAMPPADRPPRRSPPPLGRRLLEIYAGRDEETRDRVMQLDAVDRFVAARALIWAPPADPEIRYPQALGAQYLLEEITAFLRDAERNFADVPALAPVFRHHKAQAAELF
jgi:hypothetical protein